MDNKILREIADNTASKQTLTMGVTDTKTRIITQLNPPIELNKNKKYQMCLISLDTFYSFPNISTDRNSYRWSKDGGNTWYLVSLPIGVYELDQLEHAIQYEIVKEGGNRNGITLQANKVTFRIILKLKLNYKIDFNVENSIRDVLGFDAKIYNQPYIEATNIVNILNINAIHVQVDCINGSYIDGTYKPVIYSFFPSVSPGYKIIEKPHNLIYLPVHVKYIKTLTVTVTDQKGNLLDLSGEQLSIRFHI